MKLLAEEKLKILAERHGWSIARAEGYVEGETFRRRGEAPSPYRLVGIDDYALGFRAGYFLRQGSRSTPSATFDSNITGSLENRSSNSR